MSNEEAYCDFLNALERVAEKYGWNIDISSNLSDDAEYPRIEIIFGHALGLEVNDDDRIHTTKDQ